ncbi:MAG TPA: exosortase/archaeosortase family protein [Phycisphaerae bacterium]|nr:exosortase/archaeosortase family protein [Phycisphaerae bacterium]
MTDRSEKISRAEGRSAGSLADLVAVAEKPSFGEVFPPATLIKIAALTALFFALNYWQMPGLVKKWMHDPNWSHGFLIPLFSLYLLYARHDELYAARRRVCLWGLPAVLLGILLTVFATFPIQNTWSQQLTMIVLVLGLVLYLGGPQVLKVTWVPIAYLVFAMPIPDMLYNQIALPLQNFAAKASEELLKLFGAVVDSTASNLKITGFSGKTYPLTVAEACSGIRSLMAFLAIGVGLAYIEDRPIWHRLVLVLSTIPVAVLCNVIRVTGTCSMYLIDKPELGQKFMHTFMGILLLPPALLMLLLINWLLNSLVVEDEDEQTDAKAEGGNA